MCTGLDLESSDDDELDNDAVKDTESKVTPAADGDQYHTSWEDMSRWLDPDLLQFGLIALSLGN